MPVTSEYYATNTPEGRAKINGLLFGYVPGSSYSSGEGTTEVPGTWSALDPSNYAPLKDEAAKRKADFEQMMSVGMQSSAQDFLLPLAGGVGDNTGYLDMAEKSGIPLSQLVSDWAAKWGHDKADAPSLITGPDGVQYLKYNNYSSKPGFLDKAADMVPYVVPALLSAGTAAWAAGAGAAGAGAGALEAGALAGAPGYGTALESSLAGLGGLGTAIDSPWGVNPQGASMNVNDILSAQDAFWADPTNAGFANLGNGTLNSVSALTQMGLSPSQILSTFGITPSNIVTQAGKSALSKILGGNGTSQDWASILGSLGATGLGVLGANQQSDALTKIANQSRADRAPFLNAATGWLNNPESYYSGAPAQAAMKGVLSGLSVNGNPANNPTAMASATEAGLRNWQNAVTGFGNIGLSGQDSRNALLAQAANADSGVYNALGYGLNQLTQPQNSLSDLLKAFNIQGLA